MINSDPNIEPRTSNPEHRTGRKPEEHAFRRNGLFLATLSGHGRVWIQSLPFSRMADRIIAHAPRAGGADKGEGSVLGGIGRMLDGR
jgi:hypothetical protein